MKKIKITVTTVLMMLMTLFQAQAQIGEIKESWSTSGNSVTSDNKFLGTITNYPFSLKTNNTVRMYIDTNGNVGLNTTAPYQTLHIVDGNILITGSSTRGAGFQNGMILFGDTAYGDDHFGRWGIEYVSSEHEGYGLNFCRPWCPNQVFGNHFLFLADSGNVGIGTKKPQAKLAVNGDILAKSIRVNTSSTYWPDYVFEDGYNLMSLSDLESYIAKNKHLPGIPSASEIDAKNEVDLGEMNALLLEKVEELTRYIIELQKQIDELKNGKEE